MNIKSIDSYNKYLYLFKQSRDALKAIKGVINGGQVYILATGPSINQTDLSVVDGNPVIYLNNAFTLRDRIAPSFECSVISDFIRFRELQQVINNAGVKLFFSSDRIFDHNHKVPDLNDNQIFMMPKTERKYEGGGLSMILSSKPSFSFDLEEGVFLGKSVVFPALQLAYYFGAIEIILLGVDMTMNRGIYFDTKIKGHWSGFDYERDGKNHFENCFELLSNKNVALLNGSMHGCLNTIPRVFYK